MSIYDEIRRVFKAYLDAMPQEEFEDALEEAGILFYNEIDVVEERQWQAPRTTYNYQYTQHTHYICPECSYVVPLKVVA
jgi:G3E family GTPase